MSHRGPSLPVLLLSILLAFSAFSLIPATQPGSLLSQLTSLSGPSHAEGFMLYSSCTFKIYSGFGAGRKVVGEGTGGHRLNFINKTNAAGAPGIPIWIGVIADDLMPSGKENGWGKRYGFPGPNGSAPVWKDSWKIAPGATLSWCAPKNFVSGRIWPRTNCVESNNTFKCETGDCLKTDTDAEALNDICRVSGTTTITGSVAEFTINPKDANGTDTNQIYYDLSFVDGYDFPIEIKSLKTDSTCPSVACTDNALPAKCLTSPGTDGGEYVGGVCSAPHVVFDNLPEHTYDPGANSISAKCADTNTNVCGCAVECDGSILHARPGPDPNPRICPDTVVKHNPYTGSDVTMRSGGCSPMNKYEKVGFIRDTTEIMPQDSDPARFATFWKQMPCDPVTGEGSFFAPYLFDFDNTSNPNPQGTRAMYKIPPPTGTWQNSTEPQIRIGLDKFHPVDSETTHTIPPADYSNILTHQVTVYVEETDTANKVSKIRNAVLALNIVDREVSIAAGELTVRIKDTSDFIGKDFTVTINIANPNLTCTPWPAGYARYVEALRAQCLGAYTWQYDDLVGLASCPDGPAGNVEQFDISFYPRPQLAENRTKLFMFSPNDKLPITLLLKDSTSVPVIGTDSAQIAMSDQDTITVQPTNCTNPTYTKPVCTLRYEDASHKLVNADASPATWCTHLVHEHQITTLHLGIDSPDDSCLSWNGKEISIIKEPAITYLLIADGTPLDLDKNYTVPTATEIKQTVDFSLTTTCIPPAADGTVIKCGATYSLAGRTFNLNNGSHTYCGQIFKPAYFAGTLTLLPPNTLYCANPAWTGDPITVYPLANEHGTFITVPANNINKRTFNDTSYSIMMNAGDALYLRVYGLPVIENGAITGQNAGICQATYSGTDSSNVVSFTNIIGSNGTANDWCTGIFNHPSHDGIHILPLDALGGPPPQDAAYAVNSNTQKRYYSRLPITSDQPVLQTALDEAANNQILRITGLPILEIGSIVFNRIDQAAVSIHGGYTNIDDATPAGYTTLRGPLVIRSGTLAVNRLKIM